MNKKIAPYFFALCLAICQQSYAQDPTDCTQLTSQVSKVWVNWKLPHLYEQMPALKEKEFVAINDFYFLYRNNNYFALLNPSQKDAIQSNPNPLMSNSPFIERLWNPKTKVLYIKNDFLHLNTENDRISSWITPKFTNEKFNKKGLPTLLVMGLIHLKSMGVNPGEIKKIHVPNVNNRKTVTDIYQNRDIQKWLRDNKDNPLVTPYEIPVDLIENAILRTQTGSYISTLATQSGHKIKSIKISKPNYSRYTAFFTPDIIANNPSFSQRMPFATSPDMIISSFELNVMLEPL